MKQTILVIFSFLFINNSGQAQSADTLYSLTVYANGGYVRNISEFEIELPGLNRNGFIGTVRIMWKPENLLRAGLEFGITQVYSVDEESVQTDSGTTNLNTNVNAYPIMAVFSMSPMENLDINIGTGIAITSSTNSSFGNESSASDFGGVFMISAGYFFPVSNNFRIGSELRGTKIYKYDDYNIALMISLAYKFLEY